MAELNSEDKEDLRQTHSLLRPFPVNFDYHNLDADKLLSAFGKYGRYQMLTHVVTNSVQMLFAINMMVMPFLTEAPEFNCVITTPENTTWVYTKNDECHIRDGNNWTLSCPMIPNAYYNYTDKEATLTADFDLVCENSEAAEHGASIFLLGGLLMEPIITQLSDLFGRRMTFLIPLYIAVVSNIICAISPTYTVFLAFRFISGAASMSFNAISSVLCMETVALEFRSLTPLVGNFFWVAGYMLAGVFRIFISRWRVLYFAISILGALTVPLFWLVPESPHWLITQKRNKQIRRYILKSSKFNRTDVSLDMCKTDDVSVEESLLDEPTRKRKRRTALDIFTNGVLLVHLLVNSYILIILNGTYWALSLFSTELSEDKWTGFFLSGLVEIPAALLSVYLLVKLNRRTVSIVSLALQSVCMLMALYAPVPEHVKIVFPLLAKLFNAMAWNSQQLLYSESTPTSIRNVFCGILEFVGDIGGVLAPYVKRLESVNPNAPTLMIAIMSMIGASVVFVLPETKNKKLPDDIDSLDPGPLLKALGCTNKTEKSSDSVLTEKPAPSTDSTGTTA
ncbi:unnamed protein product [Caenorhabditis auriculariae]|uniref:Major facilitator superfamily (MFS) profile domain-containing protein n=1 Tax=Caenorhabditis auriculariae TaxID=2777116 RepID=A0A8S1HVZ7_9PELO|nr:unnamed protein product [Caenorhabditis auriculariae]